MPDSDPSAHALDVPGARLYYERRGTGPLLLMIGSPMDSTGFAGLARALAGDYTVVTYDPRCIGNSTREDTSQDVTPGQQADDVHRLLSALGGGPAAVFGSSGGATVGLALVTAHPGQVRTLIAHEPPVIELQFVQVAQILRGLVVMAFDEERRGDEQGGHQQRDPAAFEEFQGAQGDQDERRQRRAHTVNGELSLSNRATLRRSCHQWRTMPSCDRVKVMKTLML